MVVHVKFMALVADEEGTPQVAASVIMNCPSIDALREKLEDMGALVINAEEATAQDIEDAEAAQ